MVIKIIICVAIATIIGLVVMQFIDPQLNGTTTTETVNGESTEETEDKNNYSITGNVSNPGKYLLEIDSTMEDLISAAGGVTSKADDRCFYLDAVLTSDSSYYIPPKYDPTDICGGEEITKININSAEEDDLLELTGFGSVLASNLLEYRTNNGNFNTIDDIMNVSGIGNSKFSLIKDYIILHE